MPQASAELRAAWPEGDGQAIEHLEGRGYRLRRDWQWDALGVEGYAEADASAIQYLIDEWDYGGIADPNAPDVQSYEPDCRCCDLGDINPDTGPIEID